MKIGATIRKSVSSCNQRVASIYGRTTVNRRMYSPNARRPVWNRTAATACGTWPAMMSVCVPVNLVINLWDNPDWNVYVSGGEHDRERSALRVLKINGIV